MALFEGYERREAKILAALKEFGISSIEECKEICAAKGIDPYKIVEETQPIAFENAKWAYTVGCAIAIKKGCTKAADAAASPVPLLKTARWVLATVTSAKCSFPMKPNASASLQDMSLSLLLKAQLRLLLTLTRLELLPFALFLTVLEKMLLTSFPVSTASPT